MDATHLLQQQDSSPFEDMKQDMKRKMGNWLEVKLLARPGELAHPDGTRNLDYMPIHHMPIDHEPIQWTTSWTTSRPWYYEWCTDIVD